MWFHHVRQTPDTEGRTIALNYCKFAALCQEVFISLKRSTEKGFAVALKVDTMR